MDLGLLDIIGIIIGGAIIGVIGRLLLKGRQNISMLLTIIAGIVGVLIGSLLAGAFGWETEGIWNFGEIVLQIFVGTLAVGGAAALYPRFAKARR